MAEKSGELKRVEDLDPVSTAAGAGRDESLETNLSSYSDSERRELEMTGEAPEETEHIKAQIEATRNQMGETIDAIQERLSFANISEQVSETVGAAIESAKDTAYDATIGKAVNIMKNVGDGVTDSAAFKTVRRNPLPFALIGVGAGLLAYQGFSRRGFSTRGNGRDHSRDQFRDRNVESEIGSSKRSLTRVAGKAYDGITDKANSALESVSHVAGTAYEGVAGAVTTAYSGANDIAHRAYDRAGEYGTLAYDKYDEYLEENPLVIGAIALAVGAAVGFAIPSTPFEGKLMGETRENILQRAQDAAGSLLDNAKTAALEAGQKAVS